MNVCCLQCQKFTRKITFLVLLLLIFSIGMPVPGSSFKLLDWTGYHIYALCRLQLEYSPDVLQALQLIILLEFGAVDWPIAPPRQFIFAHMFIKGQLVCKFDTVEYVSCYLGFCLYIPVNRGLLKHECPFYLSILISWIVFSFLISIPNEKL